MRMVVWLSAKKGQAVVLDMIAGLFIFLVLFSYFIILWGLFSERFADSAKQEELETRAISVAENLVGGPGHPFNWAEDPSSAQSIGISPLPNKLDPVRMDALANLSNTNHAAYAIAKQALGVGTENSTTEFYIRVESRNGTTVYSEMGVQSQNSSRLVEVSRLATLDGQMVNVKVQVYEN